MAKDKWVNQKFRVSLNKILYMIGAIANKRDKIREAKRKNIKQKRDLNKRRKFRERRKAQEVRRRQ